MRKTRLRLLHPLATTMSLLLLASGLLSSGCGQSSQPIPPDINRIFNKPVYQNAIWGLRVVDIDTGEVIYDLNPEHQFLIGSVRKLFSVGVLLNRIGPGHTSVTPVYRQGTVTGGVLHGNLILVASGDLT